MRVLRAALPGLYLSACAACVPVPVPFALAVPPLNYIEKGKPIDEHRIAFIRPGVTTKADIVWEFGAPDQSSVPNSEESNATSEDVLTYTSWRHRGVLVGGVAVLFANPYGISNGGGGGVERLCLRPSVLKIWFDGVGIVTRHELTLGETECKSEPFTFK